MATRKELLAFGFVRENVTIPVDIKGIADVIYNYNKICNIYHWNSESNSSKNEPLKKNDKLAEYCDNPQLISAVSNTVHSVHNNQLYVREHKDVISFSDIAVNFVPNLKKETITLLSHGSHGFHHFFVTNNCNVYSFGSNNCGQLGLGRVDEDETFGKLSFKFPAKIKSIECAEGPYTLFLLENGNVFICGNNTHWGLEIPNSTDINDVIMTPRKLDALDGINIIQCGMSMKDVKAVFLDDKGKVYHLDPWGTIKIFEALTSYNIKNIGCGDSHFGAVDVNGKCFLFFANNDELIKRFQHRFKTAQFESGGLFFGKFVLFQDLCNGYKEVKVSKIFCDWNYSLIVDEKNEVYIIGDYDGFFATNDEGISKFHFDKKERERKSLNLDKNCKLNKKKIGMEFDENIANFIYSNYFPSANMFIITS